MSETRAQNMVSDDILVSLLGGGEATEKLFLQAILQTVRGTESGITEIKDKLNKHIADVDDKLRDHAHSELIQNGRLDTIDGAMKLHEGRLGGLEKTTREHSEQLNAISKAMTDGRETGWRRVQIIGLWLSPIAALLISWLRH